MILFLFKEVFPPFLNGRWRSYLAQSNAPGTPPKTVEVSPFCYTEKEAISLGQGFARHWVGHDLEPRLVVSSIYNQ